MGRTGSPCAGDPMTLSIAGDGPGLDDDDHARALSRGVPLDKRGPQRAGLGLSIVFDLAALHGGRLTLRRSALGGLDAALTLPGHDPSFTV